MLSMCEYLLFEGISEQDQSELLHNARLLSCDKGRVLFKDGDSGRSIGFVKHGTVGVFLKGKRIRTLDG